MLFNKNNNLVTYLVFLVKSLPNHKIKLRTVKSRQSKFFTRKNFKEMKFEKKKLNKNRKIRKTNFYSAIKRIYLKTDKWFDD